MLGNVGNKLVYVIELSIQMNGFNAKQRWIQVRTIQIIIVFEL